MAPQTDTTDTHCNLFASEDTHGSSVEHVSLYLHTVHSPVVITLGSQPCNVTQIN